MRPEGIEPPSQEPESHVISITLRAPLNNNEYSTENCNKIQAPICKLIKTMAKTRQLS